jgi:DNA (cytosine-5)-methyltransferase 1
MGASKKYTLVDLFCGCGGLSRGFERSTRYTVEAGVELAPHPIAAFAANHTSAQGGRPLTFNGDIRMLVGPEAPQSLWEWLRPTGIREPGQLDVLVGGPPCQGFSRNGVRKYESSGQRFYDDPRNHLYRAFLVAVAELLPKVVLIENVREFLNFGGGKFSQDLLARLDELGYTADFQKVCAADYGVPQMRHRVIFIAVSRQVGKPSRLELPFPQRRFCSNDDVQLSLIGDAQYRTVRDAIADLPKPVYKHGIELGYSTSVGRSTFASEMRSTRGVVPNHVARHLSKLSLDRINAVGTGRMKHVAKQLQTESFYGSAYRRLAWDEPALTITTWVYHVGSGRFAHPEEDRGITMREAARLQSFDDNFLFPALINPVSQMIGNAVPPLMAKAFAEEIAGFLDVPVLSKRNAVPRESAVSA